MKSALLFDFTVDKKNNTVYVKREFAANLELIWEAWTNPEIIDQWWAPKPWRAETKSMDFREGGFWLYAMVSPENQRHWGRQDYQKIVFQKSFVGTDSFCDDNGNVNADLPKTLFENVFSETNGKTLVTITSKYASIEMLEKIIEMGFKEGFTMALENLDQYIETQFKLRQQNKTENKARVTTYLNFPGNTEEAFLFYKSVFKTEFSGKGLQRFGDIPAEAGHPPVAEAIKKMVLHVELPILGGHVLMATDAPKEMGMTVTQGNNMHICLEPETKAETKKLFDALSKDGNIAMPLADMFFGAYFGECTDRFGINWMFNCIEKK